MSFYLFANTEKLKIENALKKCLDRSLQFLMCGLYRANERRTKAYLQNILRVVICGKRNGKAFLPGIICRREIHRSLMKRQKIYLSNKVLWRTAKNTNIEVENTENYSNLHILRTSIISSLIILHYEKSYQ